MRESKLFWATLLAAMTLFMVQPILAEAEKENIKLTIPSAWTRGGKGSRGELRFITSKDPAKGLKDYIP